ncbi:hypothetical protein ACH5RR_039716 [Cinchona calisaya]|uniref:Indole-3-acetic acid-amido synthetase GH3.17-like n=1 Tax=Cinchona calisaya TaxID=153742 RepID=A0ABD2XZH5_9GENT
MVTNKFISSIDGIAPHFASIATAMTNEDKCEQLASDRSNSLVAELLKLELCEGDTFTVAEILAGAPAKLNVFSQLPINMKRKYAFNLLYPSSSSNSGKAIEVVIPVTREKEGRHVKVLVESDISQPLMRGTRVNLEGLSKWLYFRKSRIQLPTFDPTNNEANLRILDEITDNAAQIQEDVLKDILTKNANTEYLKDFLDGHPPDKELFKKKVPVVEYEDIKSYIDRIANGEPSQIITAESITHLNRSSGTSGGKRKLLPVTDEECTREALFHNIILTVLNNGLVVTSSVKHLFESKQSIFNGLTSPKEVMLCEDTKQSMYGQLICGLIQRDEVSRVGAVFALSFVGAMKFLEEDWQQLCQNIRTGQISDSITDPDCRKAISSILSKPMPDLADAIENECRGQSWEGIVKKLWPRAKCVRAVITGSMAQYIKTLEFYGGGSPLVSTSYALSEGLYGICLNPLTTDVSYTLIPYTAYYEFLPLNQKIDQGMEKDSQLKREKILDLANVKVGQQYELVVTTFSGLYRYRMGDILMVTGFHNNTPEFQFVQRLNVVLSIAADKTTEEDLIKAVTKAKYIIEPLGYLLTDYSSYADMSSIPGHYVLFWEVQMGAKVEVLDLDRVLMEQCCNILEESLDVMYKMLRNLNNIIGPLEIRVVKEGTFSSLMDFFVSQGTSLSQYKTPKSIKSEKAIQILNSRVIERFSSNVLLSPVS